MGKKNTNRVYWPNCQVCQYMKKHQEFKQACQRSTYFDPNGKESLFAVSEKWGHPVKMPTLYRHMQRHQKRDIENSEELARISGQASAVWQRQATRGKDKAEEVVELIQNTEKVIDANSTPRAAYEVGLDEFIALGRANLRTQNMSISASNYIAAIKVKADIERSNKDRRVDLLRNMFAGAAPTRKDDETS
jgi:hypothetical protein